MIASILKDLDKVEDAAMVDLAKAAAMRIRVLEKGIRDGLRFLSILNDEDAIEALTGALRSGYGLADKDE